VLSLKGNGDGKHAVLFTGTNQLAVSFVSQFPTISVHYMWSDLGKPTTWWNL